MENNFLNFTPYEEVEDRTPFEIDFGKIHLEWFLLYKWHNKTQIKGNVVWVITIAIVVWYLLFVVMLAVDLLLANCYIIVVIIFWKFFCIKVIWELFILNIGVWTYKQIFKSVIAKVMFWLILILLILVIYLNFTDIINFINLISNTLKK